jgi:hypothetical protein
VEGKRRAAQSETAAARREKRLKRWERRHFILQWAHWAAETQWDLAFFIQCSAQNCIFHPIPKMNTTLYFSIRNSTVRERDTMRPSSNVQPSPLMLIGGGGARCDGEGIAQPLVVEGGEHD